MFSATAICLYYTFVCWIQYPLAIRFNQLFVEALLGEPSWVPNIIRSLGLKLIRNKLLIECNKENTIICSLGKNVYGL